ncbi:MAG TPA: SPFH domain-containing protein [Kofleriaceae bacterium]|nr:SPFH domain-containing protein [Kofleriaceae bacterium]
MKERKVQTIPGSAGLLMSLGLLAAAIALPATQLTPSIMRHADHHSGLIAVSFVGAGLLFLAAVIVMAGMFTVAPNEARVLQFFGRYVGTARDEGWRWVNPFYAKRSLSLRMRTFETPKIKVNDVEGNPIEIGAIVVWKVVDTAAATFVVDDFAAYVRIQAEAAVRNLATHHPYDGHDENLISLRGHTDAVAEQLKLEIHDRCKNAGVEIVEARITHLAYAQEIAQAMLQRQQAGAIIAARQRIVEGAVGMVEMALKLLSQNRIVELDADRKAAMVSNLLVVLCGERATQPVINTGTLYQG